MPRRAVSLAILLLFVVAAPAQAKCCLLQHLEISGPGYDDPLRFPVEALEDQLGPAEQGNLYWPVLNGSNKGDHRPDHFLGPRYDVTYVLEDTEGEPIEFNEVVYLEATPPVAYTPKGQTSELVPGDVREVPWGWRPFPDRAANALRFLLGSGGGGNLEGDMASVPVIAADARATPWWQHPVVLLLAVLGFIAGLVSVTRRARQGRVVSNS